MFYEHALHFLRIIYTEKLIHFQGRQVCQNCFAPFWKGVHSTRKEFAPLESKFFPSRVDSSGSVMCTEKQTGSDKIVSLEQNGGQSTKGELGHAMRNVSLGICGQRKPRSACASPQSDQGIHCPLTESFRLRASNRRWSFFCFFCTCSKARFSLDAAYLTLILLYICVPILQHCDKVSNPPVYFNSCVHVKHQWIQLRKK